MNPKFKLGEEEGMSNINTGGPAFPFPASLYPDGTTHEHGELCMTLRDYFAAKAMQSLISSTINDIGASHYETTISLMSYRMADVMLKAREQQT